MIRQACQNKLKISDELINTLTGEVFPEDQDLKCYSVCMLEMYNMMKKGKVLYDGALKQMDIMLPEEVKEPSKNALNICRDAPVGIKDNCEAGYAMTKCLYKNNPTFFFP